MKMQTTEINERDLGNYAEGSRFTEAELSRLYRDYAIKASEAGEEAKSFRDWAEQDMALEG